MSDAWPALSVEQWRPTYDTLHLWLQIAGKTRLALTPHVNHWWEVPLYVHARGLTTSPIPYRDEAFEVSFDFLDHELRIETSWGARRALPLKPMAVADFYAKYMAELTELGLEVRLNTMPQEVPNPIRFEEDRAHASYDAAAARRCFRALLTADALLKEFRARFLGKDSPVHLFWGSFDLAATRFSGRRAPPRAGADEMTREAYSHEVISAGFWPGGGGVEASFYAYAAPEPAGFADAPRPPGAAYNRALKEFLLPWDEARRAKDPKAAVLDFFQQTYEAGATLGRWDRASLERPRPWPTA